MDDPKVAFVQTPQYYANTEGNRIAAASWAQQALFFGAIARGKDGLDAVFCCGTNVLFRREAFESVGGFPTNSLTEDFELSIHLHEKGWSSAYVPDVLARGLGPEDTAAYVSQQQRWARGCLSGIPRALRARLPLRLKAQYLLSGLYFLSGWTVLIYMSFPVVRLLGGGQPIGGIDAPEFLLHFVPYYAVALTMAAVAGAGSYTFAAFALSAANFWIHVLSTVYTVLRKKGSFVVTPKKGAEARQPAAVMPALVAVGVLVAACIYGLIHNPDAATINNVSFAAVHVSILMTGCWAALQKPRARSRRGARARRGRSREPAGARRGASSSRRGAGRARGRGSWRAAAGAARRRARPPSPGRRPARRTGPSPPPEHFLDRYVSSRRARRPDRPGRRHRRRGAGIRHAAGGRHRRLAPLRHDLGVDAEQPAAPRRADLVPVARRARRGSAGGLRRRPRRQPRAARRRLPLPPARAAAAGAPAGQRDHARWRSPRSTGAPGADGRSLGGHARRSR